MKIYGLLLLLTLITSCAETQPEANHDIYVCGYTGIKDNKNAAIWVNGIMSKLETPLRYSVANAMTIVGDDIYCVGTAILSDNKIKSAVYWKNGVIHPLSDGKKDAEGLDIAIIDDVVYCVGRQNNGIKYSENIVNVNYSLSTSYHSKAMVWCSDGKVIALSNGKSSAGANAINVSSQGDIIIAGYDEGYIRSGSWYSYFYRYARAWDISGKTIFGKKEEKNVSEIYAISSHNGEVVYAGIYDDTPDSDGTYGEYWIGKFRYELPDNFGQINDVKQTDTGLYFCGKRRISDRSYGNLWINGVLYSYDQTGTTNLNALDVIDNDIYCTGALGNVRVAVWHNHQLMDWGAGVGLDIVVLPQKELK